MGKTLDTSSDGVDNALMLVRRVLDRRGEHLAAAYIDMALSQLQRAPAGQPERRP